MIELLGSVSQIRECSSLLQSFAKENDITLFVIGHVTKTGEIAGPKTLEHIVDTVCLIILLLLFLGAVFGG